MIDCVVIFKANSDSNHITVIFRQTCSSVFIAHFHQLLFMALSSTVPIMLSINAKIMLVFGNVKKCVHTHLVSKNVSGVIGLT